MKLLNLLTLFTLVLCVSSCNNTSNPHIAQTQDYEQYLSPDQNPNAALAQKELDFWSEKYKSSPSQYPYLSKMAGAQSQLFEYSGDITYLHEAYKNLQIVTQKTNATQPGALRSLARNCISQHKFLEAYDALQKAEKLGDQPMATNKMMFDVCLELGKKDDAEKYLKLIETESGFDYKIRLAKWKDHEGDLDGAITLMEDALAEAEKEKNEDLILWSTTNLADFYGHAERIQDSYNQYLKALSLDPNNSYALKGIAWIAFSQDKNIPESKRILLALQKIKDIPDYDLRLAEIADYENDEATKEKYLQAFLTKIKDLRYGDMYNTYEAEIVNEDLPSMERAFELAKTEINNRPTPQSYALLAWAYYKNNDNKKALEIIEQNVANQTYEPAAQYKMAVIYRANNLNERVHELKADLEGSSYELGPVMGRKIGSL